MKFLLWCVLLVFCWPVALLAIVLYPVVWLLLLPFRIVGIAVGGVLELISGLIFLPHAGRPAGGWLRGGANARLIRCFFVMCH